MRENTMSRHRTRSAQDFDDAYMRGFFKRILATLTGRTKETHLLSYEEVRSKIRCHDESYTGMKTVPVDAIIGSVGRYKDFDREFLPLRRQSKERWRRISEAYYQDIVLPPVQLYKVGDAYFVKDGNHRVSVAKEHGITYIDAEVIETRCKVPLTKDIDAEDLEEVGAQAFFLEWSRLDSLRPDQQVRVTVPGGYHELEEHINVHRYFLGLERQVEVPLWDAVASWYDNVYMPVVELIREENILSKFPQRTETDLYLWIMDHLYDLRQRYGDDVDAGDAMESFVQHHARRSIFDVLRQRLDEAISGGSDKGQDKDEGIASPPRSVGAVRNDGQD